MRTLDLYPRSRNLPSLDLVCLRMPIYRECSFVSIQSISHLFLSFVWPCVSICIQSRASARPFPFSISPFDENDCLPRNKPAKYSRQYSFLTLILSQEVDETVNHLSCHQARSDALQNTRYVTLESVSLRDRRVELQWILLRRRESEIH